MADETEGDFWRDVRQAMQKASKQRREKKAFATGFIEALMHYQG